MATTDYEQQYLDDQMAIANALRKRGMEMNDGSRMVGPVLTRGNILGPLAQAFGGAFMADRVGEQRKELENRRQQEFDTFMGARPSIYNEFEGQVATPEQQFGPTQAPVVKQKALKSAAQMLEDQQNWIARPVGESNPLIQAVRQQAMLKGLDWPEKMLTQEGTLQLGRDKIAADAQNRQDQRDFLAGQGNLNRQSREDMIRLTAALRPPPAAPAPHTSIAYDKEGNGFLVDMRNGTETPLSHIGKVPGGGAGSSKLSIQAQKMQSALQNLESGLGAYEKLLKDYNPRSADAVTPEKRAALSTAFGDLRMQLKEAYALGAITGPDMQVLEGVLTDPTGALGMSKGLLSGNNSFNAQIEQSRAALNRQKRNFEQQYGVTLPEPAGTATAPMPGAAPEGFKVLGVRDK